VNCSTRIKFSSESENEVLLLKQYVYKIWKLVRNMIRKSGVVLLGLLVGLFLVVVSWPYLFYDVESRDGGISGNSIRDVLGSFYEMSSINQRIFILVQVVLLIVIVIAVFFIVRKFRHKQTFSKGDYVVKDGGKRSRTDLDVLYEMLKKRKEIDLEDVERVFKVSSEVALGWAKVLENGELAEIDYPRFGKPVLRLLEEENAEDKSKKAGVVMQISRDVEKKKSVIGKKIKVLTGKIKNKKVVEHKASLKKEVKVPVTPKVHKENIVKKKKGIFSLFRKKKVEVKEKKKEKEKEKIKKVVETKKKPDQKKLDKELLDILNKKK
jgi:uncharacterized membrane protein